MADLYLTLEQLEVLFWKVTMQMLGYTEAQIAAYNDPNNPKKDCPVRISWPAVGAPAWKRGDDVVFIRIGEDDDPINMLRDVVYEPKEDDPDTAVEQTGQTRVLRVHWVCYGPHAFDTASKIRRLLYTAKYRQPLSDNQIYLVPSTRAPVRAPENFEGQWWDRADYSAQFNDLVQTNVDVPYIKSATVTVTNQKGKSSNADVPPKD